MLLRVGLFYTVILIFPQLSDKPLTWKGKHCWHSRCSPGPSSPPGDCHCHSARSAEQRNCVHLFHCWRHCPN
ncbi:hypothetical protein predicted by Glimmer/Critica [Azoarcus olearius]|uniref:Uncharacterized protein n=1 Tax=Azoarcus sp. (strain BH72) TaxID=418699 RepID=A1K6D8_AZOSB|nr:hypothetical protein predicted by Glimmer/Critica [Azoarcus olearius]